MDEAQAQARALKKIKNYCFGMALFIGIVVAGMVKQAFALREFNELNTDIRQDIVRLESKLQVSEDASE